MQKLIDTAKQVLETTHQLPFSLYTSVGEQVLSNVPLIKPTLVCVLRGCKQLGSDGAIQCPEGQFLFLSNSPNSALRNIPNGTGYIALIIPFDYQDFHGFKSRPVNADKFINGKISSTLEKTLEQFLLWSAFAPMDMWTVRRQEILQLLYHLGFEDVSGVVEPPSLSHRVHNLISDQITVDINAEQLAAKLVMSESTLRRKLSAESSGLQAIKDNARLGYGLHLVQTSAEPIGLIAEQCGYQSQSRFTDRFKQLFGLTPTELRKTQMSV